MRELALRELASEIDARRRERPENSVAASDQIMVCLSSQGPNAARLLRFGSRLAGRLNRNWYAVYVQTPAEEATRIDAKTQRLLADTLTLANQLGATVFTFKGDDIADTIMRFAAEYHVGQIVIGKPHPIPRWRRFIGERSVAERLIFKGKNATVIVVDADAPDEQVAPKVTGKNGQAAPATSDPTARPGLKVDPKNVIVFREPVSREHLFHSLIDRIQQQNAAIDGASALVKMREREARGSTFLNEGIGLPHARIDGLDEPVIAIAVTHSGVLDSPVATPIEIVVLLLTPSAGASTHLKLLATIARLWQDRDLRKRVRHARTPEGVVEAIGALPG